MINRSEAGEGDWDEESMLCLLQTAKDKHCLKTLARQRRDVLSFTSGCERPAPRLPLPSPPLCRTDRHLPTCVYLGRDGD